MGVPCRCPRTGGLGQGQYLFLRCFLRSKKRNSAAAEKRGRGGNSFSPHPFFFPPRPSENYQNSASGFSLKKVRILSKTDSQFVKFAFPASLGASPLASADEFSSNFQTSQSFFRPKGERKAAIFLPKNDYKYNQIKI